MEVKMTPQLDIAATASLASANGMQSLRILIDVLATLAFALRRRVMAASHRRRVERELQALPDVMLKDIGVTRTEIPWIAVTQAERIRAHGSLKQGQVEAHDRRHTRNRTSGFAIHSSQ
jgi:uncharacterized protein YjiS (DUF1127 family)